MPPEFSALGQWAACGKCRGTGGAMPRHRGFSPFGNVHRSGCPPAEPYPADAAPILSSNLLITRHFERDFEEFQFCSVSAV